MKTYIFVNDGRKTAHKRAAKVLARYLRRWSRTTWAGQLSQEALHDILVALRSQASKNSSILVLEVGAYGVAILTAVGRAVTEVDWVLGARRATRLKTQDDGEDSQNQ